MLLFLLKGEHANTYFSYFFYLLKTEGEVAGTGLGEGGVSVEWGQRLCLGE